MSAGRPDGAWLPDPARIRRGFDAASEGFDRVAFLQPQIREQLLARLDLVRLDPRLIVDAGCATGRAAPALLARYRRARVVALDLAPRMAAAAARQGGWRQRRRITAVCADALRMPLPDQSVDLVFSSLLLPWHPAPERLFREICRVLCQGGLLTFATFGPDTLRELSAAWRQVDTAPHVNLFLDMHDVGDALLRAGLGDPVMDVQTFTVTYPDFDRLLADLRATGGGNALAGRRRGLLTPRAATRLRAAYEAHRAEGRLPATVEVVFGHAWGTGAPRAAPVREGEVRFPVSALRKGGQRPA